MLRPLLLTLLAFAMASHAHADGKLVTILSQKHEKPTVQEFYGIFYCAPEGAKPGIGAVEILIDETATDGKGNNIRKPGKVALNWGNAKKRTYWGTAESIAGGEVKLIFADRKPVTLKLLRAKPTEDSDYQPFFSLKEDGGKRYLCGYSAG